MSEKILNKRFCLFTWINIGLVRKMFGLHLVLTSSLFLQRPTDLTESAPECFLMNEERPGWVPAKQLSEECSIIKSQLNHRHVMFRPLRRSHVVSRRSWEVYYLLKVFEIIKKYNRTQNISQKERKRERERGERKQEFFESTEESKSGRTDLGFVTVTVAAAASAVASAAAEITRAAAQHLPPLLRS